MTLLETINRIKQKMSYDFDPFLGDSPTDAQYITIINGSIRRIAKEAKMFHHSIPITLVDGQVSYETRNVSSNGMRITNVKEVIVNGRTLNAANHRYTGVWSLDELQRVYPRWRSQGPSSPILAAVSGTQIILYPAPSADTITAGENYIVGNYIPADLSTTANIDITEIPLPIELHEAVVNLTICELVTPTVTESAQIERVRALTAEWQDAVKEIAKENANNTALWGTTYGETSNYRYL